MLFCLCDCDLSVCVGQVVCVYLETLVFLAVFERLCVFWVMCACEDVCVVWSNACLRVCVSRSAARVWI